MGRRVKILQLATVDNGGATWFYKDALDQHTSHDTRAVRTYQGWLAYPGDVINPEPDVLQGLYDWADVVHLHDEAGALVQEFKPKPTVITYHGSRYRSAPEQYNQRCEKRGWLVTVSTLDLTEWGGRWIPTPRRDVADDYKPARRFVVVHAPTNRERKKSDLIIEAVRADRGCRLQLIENTPYRRCMQRKAKGRVLVDGWLGYGSNAVEAWALGMPVISGASYDLQNRMREAWGYVPFMECHPSRRGLWRALESIKNNDRQYRRFQNVGRSHYLAYHHPYHVAQRLVKLYEEAMEVSE